MPLPPRAAGIAPACRAVREILDRGEQWNGAPAATVADGFVRTIRIARGWATAPAPAAEPERRARSAIQPMNLLRQNFPRVFGRT